MAIQIRFRSKLRHRSTSGHYLRFQKAQTKPTRHQLDVVLNRYFHFAGRTTATYSDQSLDRPQQQRIWRPYWKFMDLLNKHSHSHCKVQLNNEKYPILAGSLKNGAFHPQSQQPRCNRLFMCCNSLSPKIPSTIELAFPTATFNCHRLFFYLYFLHLFIYCVFCC